MPLVQSHADAAITNLVFTSRPATSLKSLGKQVLLLMQVLACSCSKVSDQKLLQQAGRTTLQLLRTCHDAGSKIMEKSLAAKLFTSGFRALNSVLAALRGQHSMNTAELVDLLRNFFTYGIELDVTSRAAFPASATGETSLTAQLSQSSLLGSKLPYRPPHARRRSSSNSGWPTQIYACKPCDGAT